MIQIIYFCFCNLNRWPTNNGWSQERGEGERMKNWAGHDFLDIRVSGRKLRHLFYNSANTANCFCWPAILVHDPKWLTDLKLILISLNSPLHVDFKWCKAQKIELLYNLLMSKISRTSLCTVWPYFEQINPDNKYLILPGWWWLKRCKNKASKKRDYFRVMTRADLTRHHGSWSVLIGFTVTLWSFLDTRSLTLLRSEEREEGTRVTSWMYWATLISLWDTWRGLALI